MDLGVNRKRKKRSPPVCVGGGLEGERFCIAPHLTSPFGEEHWFILTHGLRRKSIEFDNFIGASNDAPYLLILMFRMF